jgi:hypothetical protein
VKKSIMLSAGSAVAASAMMALFGTGVAAADDYAGKTYADAAKAIQNSGGTPIVAARFGDKLQQDECIVTGSLSPSFVRPKATDTVFETVTSEVRLNLNCNGGYATAANPGNSLASPEGREAKAAADQAAAQEEQTLEEASTPNQ